MRYRFALVNLRRPSDSLILLVACPALYCPLLPFSSLLPFTALYLPFSALYCPLLLFTAFCCPIPALYCPVLHFAALDRPLLPSAAWGVAHKTIWWVSIRVPIGYRLGYRLPSHISHGILLTNAAAARKCHNK